MSWWSVVVDTEEADEKKKIEFVQSINEHNLQLINHTDQKTTIIVGINGVLLGLLSQSYSDGLLKGANNPLIIIFVLVSLLLGTSAIAGLVVIFPRIYRDRCYEKSFSYHEIIVGKKPWDRFDISSWFERRFEDTEQRGDRFENFKNRWENKITFENILDDGIYNAYMLAEKLNHMVVWVSLSLLLLLAAVVLLTIFLSFQFHSILK